MIIDQLPTISDVQNSDELPIERGQTTYKTTVGKVVDAVSKIVAYEYDNTSTYAVGDYCIHEGTLYVCNTDISTAEEWNASHWTATNVTDEIPTAYTSNPEMDGTASPGSGTAWAKGDHVHPHDTSKADTGLGITGATVGKVPVISAVDGNGVPTAFDAGDGGDVTADMLGIVINGNSTPVGASIGQYVIVKNSTISGITDGLYTAEQAIPANTAIDATYLMAVSGGGLNDILVYTPLTTLFDDTHRQISYLTYPALKLLFVFVKSDGQAYTASDFINLEATLPASIAPIISTSAITRKLGYVTVATTRAITFKLMKDQVWDQGYVVVPYL